MPDARFSFIFRAGCCTLRFSAIEHKYPMITGAIKNQVDQIWNTFSAGGVSDPLSVIEQITYLLFVKHLDEMHIAKEKQASLLGNTFILTLADLSFKNDCSDSDTQQWLITNGHQLMVDFIDLFFAQD